ncbi:MAG: hypothetical protein ACYDCQ_14375 [Dehalococcoidia bacterium]
MYSCAICHFKTELDDVVVAHGEQCICLRCYGRETDSGIPMPKELRHAIIDALAEREPAWPE